MIPNYGFAYLVKSKLLLNEKAVVVAGYKLLAYVESLPLSPKEIGNFTLDPHAILNCSLDLLTQELEQHVTALKLHAELYKKRAATPEFIDYLIDNGHITVEEIEAGVIA